MTLFPFHNHNSCLSDQKLISHQLLQPLSNGIPCVDLQTFRSSEQEPAPIQGASQKGEVDRYLEEDNGFSRCLGMFMLGIDINDTAFGSTTCAERKILRGGGAFWVPGGGITSVRTLDDW